MSRMTTEKKRKKNLKEKKGNCKQQNEPQNWDVNTQKCSVKLTSEERVCGIAGSRSCHRLCWLMCAHLDKHNWAPETPEASRLLHCSNTEIPHQNAQRLQQILFYPPFAVQRLSGCCC